MRKVLVTLMMVFGLSVAFAKSVVLNVKSGGEDCLLITDDEHEPIDASGLSDTDIVRICKSCVPEKLKDNEKLIYCGYVFNNGLNEPAKKYYTYWLFGDHSTEGYKRIFIDTNLGDGRMLRLIYLIERNNEYGGVNPYSVEE